MTNEATITTETATVAAETPEQNKKASKKQAKPASKKGSKAASKPAAKKDAKPASKKASKKEAKPAAAKKPAKAKDAAAPREGSKKQVVLLLLARKEGATMAEIADATGWQKHSIRGFISGNVTKKMGLVVESTKNEQGERTYRTK
jgi:hypothetical protein